MSIRGICSGTCNCSDLSPASSGRHGRDERGEIIPIIPETFSGIVGK